MNTRPSIVLAFVVLGLSPILGVSPAQADELRSAAKRLSKGLSELQNKRVAVLPFTYSEDQMSSGSSLVAERLTTELVNRHVAVVERSQLAKIMSEIKLEKSGAVDPISAQKLGKLLGVDAIVTGSMMDLDNNVTEIHSRLIRTETGEILSAADFDVHRQWTDQPHRVFVENKGPAPAKTAGDNNEMMSALIPVHYGSYQPSGNGGGNNNNSSGSSGDAGSYGQPHKTAFDAPSFSPGADTARSQGYYPPPRRYRQ